MNAKQKICLWIGITVFVLMGLYPPWKKIINISDAYVEKYNGYAFILSSSIIDLSVKPDEDPIAIPYYSIDIHRLLVQWFIVIAITFGFVKTFSDKQNKLK